MSNKAKCNVEGTWMGCFVGIIGQRGSKKR